MRTLESAMYMLILTVDSVSLLAFRAKVLEKESDSIKK